MNSSGILYVVATPIGNLEDFSQRAIRVLKTVDRIAAEDTRHSSRLMQHYGITTSLIPLHQHNEHEQSKKLIEYIKNGKSLALISDAGTPLISDPGYPIVKMAQEQGIQVVPIPGACAAITALSASGLPADKFIFEGFLPVKAKQRNERLQSFEKEPRTIIFYEAPHRVLETITAMADVLGGQRYAVLARELTKTFETIYGNTLSELIHWITTEPKQLKGEFVILLAGAKGPEEKTLDDTNSRILDILLNELPLKQATQIAAKITGINKNLLYDWALTKTRKKE